MEQYPNGQSRSSAWMCATAHRSKAAGACAASASTARRPPASRGLARCAAALAVGPRAAACSDVGLPRIAACGPPASLCRLASRALIGLRKGFRTPAPQAAAGVWALLCITLVRLTSCLLRVPAAHCSTVRAQTLTLTLAWPARPPLRAQQRREQLVCVVAAAARVQGLRRVLLRTRTACGAARGGPGSRARCVGGHFRLHRSHQLCEGRAARGGGVGRRPPPGAVRGAGLVRRDRRPLGRRCGRRGAQQRVPAPVPAVQELRRPGADWGGRGAAGRSPTSRVVAAQRPARVGLSRCRRRRRGFASRVARRCQLRRPL